MTPSGGLTGTVSFSVSGMPPGVTATFDPASVPLPGSSTLNVTSTTGVTPPGTYAMTISAADGPLVHTAAITFVSAAANQAPVAVADTATTVEDVPVTIAVLSNDSDPDNDPLTVSGVSAPAHGVASINPDNTITYSPAADYNGLDSFSYTVGDGAGNHTNALVTVTITPVNDPPVAANDSYGDQRGHGADGSGSLRGAGERHRRRHRHHPDRGARRQPLPRGGDPERERRLLVHAGGELQRARHAYLQGDRWPADSNVATVTITIAAVNDAPVANAQNVTTNEDTARSVTLTATDVEGSALTYTVVAGPAHGTLTGTPPALTYTPAANYSGADSFTFKANDGALDSNVATVSITVTAVNDAPVASGQAVVDERGHARRRSS